MLIEPTLKFPKLNPEVLESELTEPVAVEESFVEPEVIAKP